MSKNGFKKFRKNDYSYDEDEEYYESPRGKMDKRKARRIDRALRTKDISELIEDDDLDPFEAAVSTFEEERE